jgi:regulator of RNase E activity RraA
MSLVTTLQELREFDTALLANTIGYIDPTPPHDYYMGGSIRSLTPTIEPTVGVAFTAELDSSTPTTPGAPAAPAPQYDFYDQLEDMSKAGLPVVWVVKAVGSRPDHECIMGDGMGKALFASGCVGAVTDGGVRDLKGLMTIPFAVYGRGVTIHHSPLRFRSFNQPVEVGGLLIRPGDVLHANCEGVIRIPPACLDILPAKATAMRAFEHDAHRAMRRTDWNAKQKRDYVMELLITYKFRQAAARADL